MKLVTSQPYDLKLIHASKQPRTAPLRNPCAIANGGCEQWSLCLMESPTRKVCKAYLFRNSGEFCLINHNLA